MFSPTLRPEILHFSPKWYAVLPMVTVQALVSTAATLPVTVRGAGAGLAAGFMVVVLVMVVDDVVVVVAAMTEVLPSAATRAMASASLCIGVSVGFGCVGQGPSAIDLGR